MSRKKKDILLPEHLPSTTRAVAWGAMFFSVLAFIVSVVTFALAYKDGVVAERATNLLREVKSSVTAAKPASGTDSGPLIDWTRVNGRLERIQRMLASGDGQARYHLEALMDDLEGVRTYTTEKGSEALGSVIDSLGKARDYTEANAPAAIDEIQSVLSTIKGEASGQIDKIGEAVREKTPAGGDQ